MPILTENTLSSELRSNKIDKLYFIFGEEKYLVEGYTKKLEKLVLTEGINDFNYMKVDDLNFNLANIFNFVESLPFLGERKFLKIVDLKPELFSKTDLKKFSEVFKDLPDYITVVVCQAGEDVNLKSSGWVNFYKFFQKYGSVVKMVKLSRYNLELTLEKWARKEGVFLDSKTVKKVVDLCPNSLIDLRSEFDKILAFYSSGKDLYENVEDIIFSLDNASVFDLTKAIVNGNIKVALEKLQILFFKNEEPVFILNTISSFFLDVYRVKISGIYKEPTQGLKNFFDYKNKEFRLRIAKDYSKNLSLKDIKNIILLVIKTDIFLKTSNLNKKILIEELIVRIIFITGNKY